MPSNYPPGVTGSEPQITGAAPEPLRVRLDVQLEVNRDAWEAFAGCEATPREISEWVVEVFEISQARNSGAIEATRVEDAPVAAPQPDAGITERVLLRVLADHQRVMTKPGGPCWCGEWPHDDVRRDTWMDHVVEEFRAAVHQGRIDTDRLLEGAKETEQ